jgi:hypothetical protein
LFDAAIAVVGASIMPTPETSVDTIKFRLSIMLVFNAYIRFILLQVENKRFFAMLRMTIVYDGGGG